MKLISTVLLLILVGCSDSDIGKCAELTDGSGRSGIVIGYRGGNTILRMTDTGNTEAYFYDSRTIYVEQSKCQ